MRFKRESLIKLLKLIDEISVQPGNEWFKSQLIKYFSQKTEVSTYFDQGSLESKINLIQKYLSIDVDNLFDYSDFEEPSREQLFRDNLEMIRYRKGVANHKINYGEFCRYAHLQAEEMINYYFNKTFKPNMSDIVQFIKKYANKYNPQKLPSQIHHIDYSFKLIAITKSVSFKKETVDKLFYLNKMRNEISHRNSLSIENDDKVLALYEKEGFARSKIKLDELSEMQKNIYNEGKFIMEKRKEDFGVIQRAIEDLRETIITTISNPILNK